MTCREIIAQIEKDYPTSCALEWDNVGLLAGRMDKEVKRVYIGLDATDPVIREAADKGADLLFTHHPLLFHGITRVTDQDFLGNRVLNLIRSDISYYAMHTNYDVVRMAQLAAARLGWKGARPLEPAGDEAEDQGLGQIADLEQEMTLEELGRQVKEVFGLPDVRIFGDPGKRVKRAAILPGSGKSVIPEALGQQAQVLITGDIGHHEGIDAVAQGLAVIDGGHYGIEPMLGEEVRNYLEEHFPELKVETEQVRHHFGKV